MVSPIRCPACGNENPPEYPPEQFSFCMECGAQLGGFRPQGQPDPYGRNPNDPYGGQQSGPSGGPYGQQGGPPPGPYGQQAPNPYGGQQAGYGGAPADPYGGQGGYGGQQSGPPPAPFGQPQPPAPYGGQQGGYGGGQPGYGSPEPSPYAPPAPVAAKLILESGLGKVEYPLDAGIVTIGRSRSNDISLEDARVSRHHARVVRGERGYTIEDLNSRNGTRVDDRAIRESAPLSEGSVVKIGDAVFRFTASAGNPGSPVGPAVHQAPPQPQPNPGPWGAPANPAGPPPGPYGHGGGPGGHGGPPAGPQVPVVFMSPWNPLQCPGCQGLRTMVQMVFGPAAQSPGAQTAARRGEIIIGEGPLLPDGPNAECRACGTRVRIVQSGS